MSEVASAVVARGQRWNELQFPSPLYFSHWVDDSSVLVGAGGGGKRFGMANVAAVFTVDTTAGTAPAAGKAAAAAAPPPEEALWAFQCAVDLGGDIPWCSSGFVKFDPSVHGRFFSDGGTSASAATLGLVAISHVDSFSVVAIRRHLGTMALFMERVVRQPLHFDETDPDKKPISIAGGCVVVSQDDKSVAFFRFAELVPLTLASAAADADDGKQQTVCMPAPSSRIGLPARVNDLSAVLLPASLTGTVPKIVVAASVQDKLLHILVASVLVDTNNSSSSSSSGGGAAAAMVAVNAAQLSAASMHFPKDIAFTKSALRSVLLTEPPGCRLLLFVNHGLSGYTYVTDGTLDLGAIGLLCNGPPAAAAASSLPPPSVPLVEFAPTPTRLIKDGVTCFAPVPGQLRATAAAAAAAPARKAPRTPVAGKPATPVTAAPALAAAAAGLAEHWLMGTVDGRVLLVRYSATRPDPSAPRFAILSQRPASLKSSEGQLHREPISSVAVSNRNDVVTTDIAQKAVISALPHNPPGCAGSFPASMRRKNARLLIFPDTGRGLWLGCCPGSVLLVVVAFLLLAAATSGFVMALNPAFRDIIGDLLA